jgi:hypothetical protein
MLDTDCVSDLNRLSNEVEERAVVKRFAALAALQYHRHYNLASLRKLPPLHVTPQPDFECEVSGWESVRLEVVSLRDENVVRVVKYLDSEVISTSDPSVRIVTNGHPTIWGSAFDARISTKVCVGLHIGCGFSGWRRGRSALSGLTGAQTLASKTWHRSIL